MTTLLCRICWNTEGWRRPTGEARRLESHYSFVAQYGFGHEEWLFNQEWTLDGYRYGFIQALNSSRATYLGQTVALELYTRTPSGRWCKAATMRGVQVLADSQVADAVSKMRRLGWLDSMEADLANLGIQADVLARAKPHELINIVFAPDAFDVLDPPEPFSNQVTFGQKYRRYRAFKVSDPSLLSTAKPARRGRRAASQPKSAEVRPRRGTPPASLDPKHDRLQNAVHEFLLANYSQVEYEAEWVDLRATVAGERYLFEVKAASSAKRCIREAVGQLLEYAHYPDRDSNPPLVVVGDAMLTNADRAYITLLRRCYRLRIRYARWDWEGRHLTGFPSEPAL